MQSYYSLEWNANLFAVFSTVDVDPSHRFRNFDALSMEPVGRSSRSSMSRLHGSTTASCNNVLVNRLIPARHHSIPVLSCCADYATDRWTRT